MADKKCKYEGCNRQVGMPLKSKFCIFHAPTEEKGVAKNDFNQKIEAQISKGDYNFGGYIFPNNIEFWKRDNNQKNGYIFNASVDFSQATFEGNVDFSYVKFKGNDNVDGAGVELSPILNCVQFINTTFKKRVIFHGTIFYKISDFSDTNFLSKADFAGATFFDKGIFHGSSFEDQTHFIGNQINKGLDFIDIIFKNNATFYFGAPIGKLNINKNSNHTIVVFNHVIFNAFNTYFENIPIPFDRFQKIKKEQVNVILIFRYCQLKDVYFTNNNMSLFSFHKSSFDQARISLAKWNYKNDKVLFKTYKRENIILEEDLIEKMSLYKKDDQKYQNIRSNYHIDELYGCEDVASLYRRMKTALDRTKDYQQASWFYFNEFEMKRRAIKENIENSKPKRKIFQRQPLIFIYQSFKKIFSKNIIYIFYKTFAGYGEKPMWSFLWFLIFVILFSTLILFIGIQIEENSNLKNINFGDSLLFTLYRIIPVNYLPFEYNFTVPHGFWSLFVPFLNTAVLIIMFAFILIGLKRHFRRF